MATYQKPLPWYWLCLSFGFIPSLKEFGFKDNVVLNRTKTYFSDEKFERNSKTTPSERMANFGFSAPEQINSKEPARESCDIYSLGQVIYWYLTGNIIRGLEMSPVANTNSPDKLKHLNLIIKKSRLLNGSFVFIWILRELFNKSQFAWLWHS
mgnify:CR=1 FL=1